ncbi:GGDEF domain-containing protein [Candidatus Woesearchaeota archaeon]|nr:GGDEF domain-containing protein [Candidatus Woesearchaeota archaeon]
MEPPFSDRLIYFLTGTSPYVKYLEEQRLIDPLTKLWNRGAFNLRLEAVTHDRRKGPRIKTTNERSEGNPDRRENQLELILTIGDIDYFKKINDNYGHPAGDTVLIEYADRLRNLLRSGENQIFRIGGEEFGIISVTSADPMVISDRLVAGINSKKFVIDDGREIDVTTSLGMAVYNPKEPVSSEEFYKTADQMLYISKNTGKNKATIWDTKQII